MLVELGIICPRGQMREETNSLPASHLSVRSREVMLAPGAELRSGWPQVRDRRTVVMCSLVKSPKQLFPS